MPTKQGVFISYARSDGEDLATQLRTRLESEGLTVWQDRARMEGGVGWWKQITTALEACEFMVLVMTPGAIDSEIVRKEWQYARQVGTCVFPVIGSPNLNFNAMPRWMRDVHFYNLDKEWDTFLSFLQNPCHAIRAPFMAPDLPETYVARNPLLEQIHALLVDPSTENTLPGTVVLTGAGGFGKSTLAAALCHDGTIQNAFDDGILWVTLGENPDVLSALIKIYAALTGQRPGFVDVEDAATALAEKWGENDCLLVLDEVWEPAHIQPFLRGGARVTRLLTTRFGYIASLGQRLVAINEMTSQEAMSVLTARLSAPNTSFTALRALQSLAERLGAWPLMLELAGAMLQQRLARGDTLSSAVEYLNTGLDKRGVTLLDRNSARQQNQTVVQTIELTIDQLNTAIRDAYFQLAILRPGEPYPLTTLAALWGASAALDDFETEEIIEQLVAFSLVRFDFKAGLLYLNPMLRTYLSGQLPEVKSLHERLIRHWGDPLHLPDEYAWRHFLYHRGQAGRDVNALLRDFAWLQAKLNATDMVELMADFDLLNSALPGASALHTIQMTLALAAHIIGGDKSQLAGQLLGRLRDHADPDVQNFLQGVIGWDEAPTLKPLFQWLTAPGGPLLRTLTGHRGAVTDIALLPTADRALSASEDATLRLWDLTTERELRVFEGHLRGVNTVVVSSNGRIAYSGSDDTTIRAWDVESGAHLFTLEDHILGVNTLALTPDDGRIISGAADNSIKIWDVKERRLLTTLRGHRKAITSLAVTPQGDRLVSSSIDETVRVWNLTTGAEERVLRGHRGMVRDLCLTSDGRQVISVSSDCSVKVWDVETGAMLHDWPVHRDWVNTVAVLPEADFIVTASEDRSIKMWSLTTGEKVMSVRGHTGAINEVVIAPHGGWAMSAADDMTLKIWRLEASSEHAPTTMLKVPRTVRKLALIGGEAYGACDDSVVRVWDTRTGKETRRFKEHRGAVRALAKLPNGKLISGGGDKVLHIWDAQTMTAEHTLAGHANWIISVDSVPDSTRALSGASDRTLRLWDWASEMSLHVMTGHQDWVLAVAASPDGRWALSGGRDNVVKLWNLTTGALEADLGQHQDWVKAVDIHPDGRLAFSASDDETIILWDLVGRRALATLKGHTERITDACFFADGRYIASVSLDKRLLVWSVEAREVVAGFENEVPLIACAVSDDGRLVVAGEDSGHLVSFAFNP